MFCFFSEKAVYFVSKAHRMSKNEWEEWRLSFSLVEKEIFVNLPWLFRKAYLLCKIVTTEWKKTYNFHSYILKTTFLWTYEEWRRTNKVFTEDDLLTMMVDIFRCLLNFYEKRNVRMYFIPELNVLEQYSQTKKSEFSERPPESLSQQRYVAEVNDLLGEIKNLTTLASLASFVCKKIKFPFGPLVQSFKSENRFKIINAGEKPSLFYQPVDMIDRPSYHDLFCLYNTKILQNKGNFNKEDNLEILCEIYVTLLFFLDVIICDKTFGQVITDPLEHILYFLRVFGNDYFAGDSMTVDFIGEYCDTIVKFFSEKNLFPNFKEYLRPWEQTNYEVKVRNNRCNIQKSLLKEFEVEDLPNMWLNGDFDDSEISLNNMLKLDGNKEKCENFQKTMEEKMFWSTDSNFNKLVENINEHLSSNFPDRCLKEVMAAKATKDNYDGRSYFVSHLVDHLSSMYNYGFTAGKFNFPTPAVFMSYFSQFLLNMQVVNEINDGNNQNRPRFYNQNASNISSNSQDKTINTSDNSKNKWGFIIKKGCSCNYVTYDQCKHFTIPFRSTLRGITGY